MQHGSTHQICHDGCPGTFVDVTTKPSIVSRRWDEVVATCDCQCHARPLTIDYAHLLALDEDARREVEEVDGTDNLMNGDVRDGGVAGARAHRALAFYAALHGDMARMEAQNTALVVQMDLDPMFRAHDLSVAPYRAYWYARFAASYGLALLERTEER